MRGLEQSSSVDIVVDFSASSTPKLGSDSIWISYTSRTSRRGEADTQNHSAAKRGERKVYPSDSAATIELFAPSPTFFKVRARETLDAIAMPTDKSDGAATTVNVATRRQLEDLLYRLIDSVSNETTIRIGVDFSLGFPLGIAYSLESCLGIKPTSPLLSGDRNTLGTHLIKAIGSLIVDNCDNSNNRLNVASSINEALNMDYFWGLPTSPNAKPVDVALRAGKVQIDASLEFRVVDRYIRSALGLRPSSIRQLFGAGAVGGQSLLGMGLISRLIEKVGVEQVAIWPFDRSERRITVFEIWPTLAMTKAEIRSRLSSKIYDQPTAKVALDAFETRAVLLQLSKLTLPNVTALSGELKASFDFDTGDRLGVSIIREQSALEEILGVEGWIGNLSMPLGKSATVCQ